MADTVPPWLATMRAISGTKEYDGGADNPTIMGWAQFIAHRFPDMESYCAEYKHDSIPWCGLTVGYCMAANGIKPVFGEDAVRRFLWAHAWTFFGKKLDKPKLGCVMVFTRNGGGHVALYEGEDDTHYTIRGGNQSNAVNVTRMPKSKFTGAYWPVGAAEREAVKPARVSQDIRKRMGKAIVDFEARRDGQGRLRVYDLPANDGGGAYEVAGINVRYHPAQAAKLKALIEAGRYDEAEASVVDYILAYTNVAAGWTTDPGLEFYLRDCVFNRGPKGAARILQRALGVVDDGEIGDITRAAMGRVTPANLLTGLRASREDYERHVVGYRANFWNGLVNRWDKALVKAKAFQAEQPASVKTPAVVGFGVFMLMWQWFEQHPLIAGTVAFMVALAVIGLIELFKRKD